MSEAKTQDVSYRILNIQGRSRLSYEPVMKIFYFMIKHNISNLIWVMIICSNCCQRQLYVLQICFIFRRNAMFYKNTFLTYSQSRLKLLRVCKQNPIFACLPIHDMSLIFTAAALLSASGACSASNINLLCTAVVAVRRLRH